VVAIYLCTYSWCFNDAVSKSHYITSNGSVLAKQRSGARVEGRSRGLIASTVTESAFKMRGRLQEPPVLGLEVYRLGFEPEQAFGLNQLAYFLCNNDCNTLH
jgi:hypothetical protein